MLGIFDFYSISIPNIVKLQSSFSGLSYNIQEETS